MKTTYRTLCLLFTAAVFCLSGCMVQAEGGANERNGQINEKKKDSMLPVPPSEAGLHTIIAEPWLQIDASPRVLLEGPSFDRQDNLFVVSVWDGRVFKITPDKEVSTIFSDEAYKPAGLAIHKDGRLFLACLTGQVVTINPDGSELIEVKAKYEGKPIAPDDLVFDSHGNFFVTDVAGHFGKPDGGVYRFSADLTTVQPVVQNLITANGISLAPKGISTLAGPGSELWVAESGLNRILHVTLKEDGITAAGVTIPYRFTGNLAPDSNGVDSEGNVYQCIVGQGRIVVLNKTGIPVAQVFLPGRDEGKNLGVTNVAFRPGTDLGFITAGGWIHTFRGLAEGAKLFSHE